MTDIRFDTADLSSERLGELEAWVRSLIGDVTDLVRNYGRIVEYDSGRVLLHLSQVVTDHFGNPIREDARPEGEQRTATMPLVIDLEGKPPWPAWLGS